MPDFKFFLREIESLSELHIMISVEERQIAIVASTWLMCPRQSYVFVNQHILSGLCLIPGLRIDIA